jgi:LacI family transcriptional regulator
MARMLEVSPSTVSRALSGNTRISKATREKVADLAERYQYNPNTLASSLRIGKTMTIGVVIPRINRHFFSNVISGMESLLNSAGYNLLISQSKEGYQQELKNLESLIRLRVDAIFISLSSETTDTAHLKNIIDQGTRLIMFDRVDPSLNASSVILDDYLGAYLMTTHLLEQGFRKIHHLSGPLNLETYQNRYRGWKEALSEAGITYDESWLHRDFITQEKSYEFFSRIEKKPDLPEAVFAASDFSALGCYIAVREKGLSIPRDIAIAGFANEPFTAFLQPGLSSIDQKAREMGETVAGLFLDSEEHSNPQTWLIKPELVIRESTRLNKI